MRRVCKKCGVEKELEEFHKQKSCKLGYRFICHDCYKKYRRNYENSKEKIRIYSKRIKDKECYIHGYATDATKEICDMKPCTYCRYYK